MALSEDDARKLIRAKAQAAAGAGCAALGAPVASPLCGAVAGEVFDAIYPVLRDAVVSAFGLDRAAQAAADLKFMQATDKVQGMGYRWTQDTQAAVTEAWFTAQSALVASGVPRGIAVEKLRAMGNAPIEIEPLYQANIDANFPNRPKRPDSIPGGWQAWEKQYRAAIVASVDATGAAFGAWVDRLLDSVAQVSAEEEFARRRLTFSPVAFDIARKAAAENAEPPKGLPPPPSVPTAERSAGRAALVLAGPVLGVAGAAFLPAPWNLLALAGGALAPVVVRAALPAVEAPKITFRPLPGVFA